MGVKRFTFQNSYIKVMICLIGGGCLLATCYIVSVLYALPLKPFSSNKYLRQAPTSDEFIKVLISTKDSQLTGAVALVNSIVQNTQKPVHFYFVCDAKTAQHLSLWLEESALHGISYEIKIFNLNDFQVLNKSATEYYFDDNFLKYSLIYIPKLFPHIDGHLICLSDDIIVQGDIADLANVTLETDDFAVLSDDCDTVTKHLNPNRNRYYHYLNMKSSFIKSLKVDGNACAFDLSVMVLNITLWKIENVTEQLEHLLTLNQKEKIFHINSILSPFLLVFRKRISHLDNSWHVRHLGITSGTRYSRKFLEKANLLHWDGNFKPWKHKSPYADLWQKYSIPFPKHLTKNH